MVWVEVGLGLLTVSVGLLSRWQGSGKALFWTKGTRDGEE